MMEHIARRQRVSALRNGATRLAADAIAVTLAPDPVPGDDEPWERHIAGEAPERRRARLGHKKRLDIVATSRFL